jgi:ribose 5-phosphate isomerase B
MRIAVGSDHRGFGLKQKIIAQLTALHHEVSDAGSHTAESVDYPDFAAVVCRQLVTEEVDRGILICGTGIGMSLAANKFPGIRAAVCVTEPMAELSRKHNDANVLCLSADLVDSELNQRLVNTWLQTEFEGGRHSRRVAKIEKLAANADLKRKTEDRRPKTDD